ncbi:MAG: site-specific integrase [Candidatus Hydrogenedentes bacterium]|nr:site-specific integrase [Candidatus Hydrogenedentota bacterium]
MQKKKDARHASGLVQLHVRYTDAISGQKKSKSIYGKTLAEAQKKKTAFLREIEEGRRVTEQGKTVGAWAEDWLNIYKRPKVKRSTLRGYENEIKHIIAAFGYKSIKSVSPMDIVALMNSRIGLSQSAIDKTFITVNAIFEAALNNRFIAFNPCKGVDIPKGPEGSHRVLDHWEVDLIGRVAKTHRFGAGVMLMLWGGLRRGEACALTSSDLVGDEIHVNKSIEWGRNQGAVGTAKTEAGERSIPVWPQLKPFLGAPGHFISTSKGEAPVSLSAFKRGLDSFIYACKVELNGCRKRWAPEGHAWKEFSFTPHDLRHTWFTMLYDAGVDVKVAASWGGHADINVTMRIYQHIRKERKLREAKQAIKRSGRKSGRTGKTYRLKDIDK